MERLSIFIPVYNEIRTVDTLLNKVISLPISNYEVLIVDDKSSDGTREFLIEWMEKYEKSNPAVRVSLFLHEQNRGKGGAAQTAIQAARGKYLIVQDADLEYEPNEIIKLLKEAEQKNLPAIFGSRFLGSIENMKLANYIANRLFNFLIFILFGKKMTDMHTCYKMIQTDLLRKINLQAEKFDFDSEVVGKLLRNNIDIAEIPITYQGRSLQEGKKIGFSDAIDGLKVLFKLRFGRNSRAVKVAN